MLEIAVLYGCDLSQVFTPIILRLYQPHSLCEKGATRAAAKAALYVFLLAPLHEGRPSKFHGKVHQFSISTPAPTRGATRANGQSAPTRAGFLLAPLHEGRLSAEAVLCMGLPNFYSRPYTRGDSNFSQNHKLIYMINC